MSANYGYTATFSDYGGTIEFNFTLTPLNNNNPPSEIVGITGSITYTNTTPMSGVSTNLSIVNTGTFGNDNLINSMTQPFFTANGLAISDNTNGIDYILAENNGVDIVQESLNQTITTLTNESLVNCLLETTMIKTEKGEILVKNVYSGLMVDCGDGKFRKCKAVTRAGPLIFMLEHDLPYMIPKGTLGATEDLYLSPGHAVKNGKGIYKLPKQLIKEGYSQIKKCSREDLFNAELDEKSYFHVELECFPGENRRTNGLIANGVLVESYSTAKIICK
jgi:hypothetical protein